MKQLKPVYSKHVEDLIVQLEDILEENEKLVFNKWEAQKSLNGYKISWDDYLNLNRLHISCEEEILRIKATQLPMFYELA